MASTSRKPRTPRTPRVAPKTESGEALSALLAARGMTQSALAASAQMPASYVNAIVTGARRPNAAWLDVVASALATSSAEAARLHRAAARDAGFKIDLSGEG